MQTQTYTSVYNSNPLFALRHVYSAAKNALLVTYLQRCGILARNLS